VAGIFELIYEGDGVVLHGDAALAVGVGDAVVGAEAEFAGALAGLKEGGGAEAGPVDAAGAEMVEDLQAAGGGADGVGDLRA
jgi:hypothetical protein